MSSLNLRTFLLARNTQMVDFANKLKAHDDPCAYWKNWIQQKLNEMLSQESPSSSGLRFDIPFVPNFSHNALKCAIDQIKEEMNDPSHAWKGCELWATVTEYNTIVQFDWLNAENEPLKLRRETYRKNEELQEQKQQERFLTKLKSLVTALKTKYQDEFYTPPVPGSSIRLTLSWYPDVGIYDPETNQDYQTMTLYYATIHLDKEKYKKLLEDTILEHFGLPLEDFQFHENSFEIKLKDDTPFQLQVDPLVH